MTEHVMTTDDASKSESQTMSYPGLKKLYLDVA